MKCRYNKVSYELCTTINQQSATLGPYILNPTWSKELVEVEFQNLDQSLFGLRRWLKTTFKPLFSKIRRYYSDNLIRKADNTYFEYHFDKSSSEPADSMLFTCSQSPNCPSADRCDVIVMAFLEVTFLPRYFTYTFPFYDPRAHLCIASISRVIYKNATCL